MRRMGVLVLAVGLVVGAASAGAEERMRHSGRVTDVDQTATRIVVDEVGPWQVRDGLTVVTRQTVEITPDTLFILARRAEPGPTAGHGDWEERVLDPWEILPGDFVTVDCRHEGRHMIALRIFITEMP
ncbi:MAG: hypothetical protein HY216_13735 [Candidatus Rokubacteria bacterium]|nr:hypothetical protein [Candidatus Rokubacteria bacterium]